MPALFDDFAEDYDSWFATPIGQKVREYELALLQELVAPADGEHILDAGCGTGVFTADFIKAGARMTGLDISIIMLRKATGKFATERFSGVQGDMLSLPFHGGSFDKVISVTAVEFLSEGIDVVIDELFRVVKPGGLVVVATLNSLSPWAFRRMQAVREGCSHIFSLARFRSPAELLRLRTESGIARTAVHFKEDEQPELVDAIETAERSSMLGAFLAVCWQKA